MGLSLTLPYNPHIQFGAHLFDAASSVSLEGTLLPSTALSGVRKLSP